MVTFESLFSDRQLLTLTTFSDLVKEIHQEIVADAIDSGMQKGQDSFHEGGTQSKAYAV